MVYVFVDWHNVQSNIAPEFHRNPRKALPGIILKIQQHIARMLTNYDGSARYRATMRIYHGWHKGREATTIRKDFEGFSIDANSARRFSRISFTPGFQFGNELASSESINPLYNTYRGGGHEVGQKMIDTAIICDLLHLLRFGGADIGIIISDDDDFIPAVLTAQAWSMNGILLRQPGSDVGEITDVNCEKFISYWSEL